MQKTQLLFWLFYLPSLIILGQTASVSTNAVYQGGTVTVTWSGFSGNVNICVYKGNTFWVYANTNVPGSGSQGLGTTGWEILPDYHIRVELRSNTAIYVNTSIFSVNNPGISLSASSVVQGGIITVYWSGFASNVNVCVYKGSVFWTYANANGSGSGQQNLGTTGWEIRSDYHVRVELKANTNIYVNSQDFPVTASLPDFIVTSVSGPSSVNPGQYVNVTLQTKNQGLIPSQSGQYVALRMILSPDQVINLADNTYMEYNIPIGDFTGGVVLGHTYSFQVPPNFSGTYYWGGYVDSQNYWTESNENNNATLGNSVSVIVPPPPTIPVPYSPSNGALINENTPDLAWTGQNSNYFHVQVDNNSDFSSPEAENTSVGAFNWTPSPQSDGTYYWRVRGFGTNGNWSNWSTVFSFTINTLPDFIILSVSGPSSATSGQTVDVTVQAKNQGQTPSQSGSYVILRMILSSDQVINLADSKIMEFQVPISSLAAGSIIDHTFTYTIPDNLSDTWYWGAYIDASCYWNESNESNNALCGNSVNLSPVCTLISPTQGQNVVTDAITFSWIAVPGAIRYELLVDNNPGLGSAEISKQHIPELLNLTATSYTIGGNWLSGNTYSWKVIAIKPGGNIESATSTFQYTPPQLSQPDWVPFYRTFNPNVVDHFYCSSTLHQLTAVSQNYRSEGAEGYIALHPFTVFSPDTLRSIFRFYIPNSLHPKGSCHYYTTNETDKDNRIIQGWIFEGITGYGYNRCHGELTQLYHTWLNQTSPDIRMDNFYTISETEKNNSINLYNYSDQGYICYISATGRNTTVPWNDNAIEFGLGINPQNGNFTNPGSTGFSIPEGRTSLNFSYFYTSSAVRFFSNVSPLGNGWTHSYNMTMSFTDSTIFLFWPGEINLYDRITFQSKTKGVYDVLTQVSTTQFQVRKKDQTVFTFEILYPATNGTAFLTSIMDRNNNTVTLSYNDKGWLKWVKSPANRYIAFNYYPTTDTARYGLIHFVKDSLALNRSLEFNYDLNRNLTQFKDPKNQVTSYGYTQSLFDHFLTSITYPDGSKITNGYDSLTRRIISQNFDYQNSSKTMNISVPTASQIHVTDQQDNPVDIDFTAGIGNITQLTTPSGHSHFEYNDPLNPTLPTKITDGNGNVTVTSYDSHGNALMIKKPHGNIHRYEYNTNNDVTKYTNPRNKITTFGYTGMDLTSIQASRGFGLTANTQMYYNSAGDLLSKTNPQNQTTTFAYNGYHNLTSATDNLRHTTTYDYDAASRSTGVTNAKNQTTSTIYDNNDLVTSSVDADNKTTGYNYNSNNVLTGVTDAKSHTTAMSYNNVTGLLETLTDQVNHQAHFTYLDNGQLYTAQNRNGQTLSYGYDSGNRLTNVTGPSVNKVFNYDMNENVTSVLNGYGQLTMIYDSLNRLTSITDNFQQKTVSYQYDPANNVTKLIYPGNKAVEYTYYDDNRLYSVKDWNNNITTYFYLPAGNLDSVHSPNGTTSKYTYDDVGRLTGLVNRKPDGSVINSYAYALDNLGNQISVSINEPLSSPAVISESVVYSYDNANRILNAGSAAFGFDYDGNMTSQNDHGLTTYTYNEEDILTSATGLLNSGFSYDALGNRRSATRNGITTRYVIDISGNLSNILMETDATGSPQYYYIYGAGLIARIRAGDNTTRYYHYDSRGSTIAMSDQSGNITHTYAYNGFGSVLQKSEADFNPFRYVGKYGVMYEDSTLYFMRARYYNPKIGRFLSEDPVWDVNLYTYTNNNPVNYIDPLGLKTQGYNIPTPYNTQGSCSISNAENTKRRLMEQLKKYQKESERQTKKEKRLKMAQDMAEMVKHISETVAGSISRYGGFVAVLDDAVLAIGMAVQGDDKSAEEASINFAIDILTAGFGYANFKKSATELSSSSLLKKVTKDEIINKIQNQSVKLVVKTTNN